MTFTTTSETLATKLGGTAGLLKAGEHTLYVEVTGQGPVLVLVHDGIVHREGWDAQFAYFSQWFTVVRYDRPGFGQAPPPTTPYSNVTHLAQLLDGLELTEVVLLGGSAGGRTALDFALAQPQRVRGLVLVGAPISGLAFSEHMLHRGWKQPFPDEMQGMREFWVNDPWLIAPHNQAAKDRLRALLLANPNNLEYFADRLEDGAALPRLAEVTAPTLITVGEWDIADNHAHAGILHVGLKNAERAIMSSAGHLVYMEVPEAFNALVYEWLKKQGLLA